MVSRARRSRLPWHRVLEPGSHIGGYRIERLVGRGGMGEVYEATQLALGRTVAFKVLHTSLLTDDGFRERFRREGKLQAQLEHPNVVTVYEAGEIPEGLFLAMRIVRGSNLKQLIVAGELDAQRTLRLLRPVADALDAAHALSLVHRDIKPQNILVGARDHPFLADFGLTRGSDDSGLTTSGQFLGTIDYVSPEQVHGEPATAASDIYALTAVLYECLTGKVPYPRPSDAAVLFAHASVAPPRVGDGRPELPAAIDEVISSGMAKEPEERPVSASELIRRADTILTSTPSLGASRPKAAGTLERGLRPVRGETEAGDPIEEAGSAPSTRTAERAWPPLPATVTAEQDETPATREMGAARRRGIAAAATIASLLAVGAFLLGRSEEGDVDLQPLSSSVSSSAVSLRAPAGWERPASGDAPKVEGLELDDRLALVRGEDAVLAGITGATGPTLLPSRLRRNAPDSPDAVRLGELDALRYRGVPVPGSPRRELTVYAAPATVGVATVACMSRPARAAVLRAACEQIAQTLQLERGRGYGLGADPATARAAASIASSLRGRRRAQRERLARARTNEGQREAARDLASAYDSAATRLSRLDVSPAVVDRLDAARAALRSAAAAYRGLGSAAGAENTRAYRRALDRVRSAEDGASKRLSALGSAQA